jgi:hypothetical protein
MITIVITHLSARSSVFSKL